ncbi:hypothetical protein LJB98_00765 [Bacteroidales bacterium OttesenSCG-928-M11]|nr:hypothetical protein [Bacteroidales bacterium OttesenSCG-928-M11]
MKKNLLVLLAAIVLVGLSACSKEKAVETEKTTDQVEVVVEDVVEEEVAPTKTPAELLKEFDAYVKEYADAFNNITKDPVKYSKLAAQSQQWVKDMAAVKDQLTEKELKSYERVMENLKKVNSPK